MTQTVNPVPGPAGTGPRIPRDTRYVPGVSNGHPPGPGRPAVVHPAHPAHAASRDGHATHRLAPGTFLSLHGNDPASGVESTWHVTSLAEDGAPTTYLLERAEGDIHNPAVWMQAQREASLAGEADVLELVRAVLFGGPHDDGAAPAP